MRGIWPIKLFTKTRYFKGQLVNWFTWKMAIEIVCVCVCILMPNQES